MATRKKKESVEAGEVRYHTFQPLEGLEGIIQIPLLPKLELLSSEYIQVIKDARGKSKLPVQGINSRYYENLGYYARSLGDAGLDPEWIGSNLGNFWEIWKKISDDNGRHVSTYHCETALILYCAGFKSYSSFAAQFLAVNVGYDIGKNDELRTLAKETLRWLDHHEFPSWVFPEYSLAKVPSHLQYIINKRKEGVDPIDIKLAVMYSTYGLSKCNTLGINVEWDFEPNEGMFRLSKSKKEELLESYTRLLSGNIINIDGKDTTALAVAETLGLPLSPYLDKAVKIREDENPKGLLKSFRKYLNTHRITNWSSSDSRELILLHYGVVASDPGASDLLNAGINRNGGSLRTLQWACRLYQRGQWGNFLREVPIQISKDQQVKWKMVQHLDSIEDGDIVSVESTFNEVLERYRDRIAATWMAGEEIISTVPEEFEEGLPEGITLLCNANMLRAEGKKMNHCVGTYISKVTRGESHIYNVSAKDGGISTLEISTNSSGQYFIIQNKASYNRDPSAEAHALSKEFVSMLNKAKQERLNKNLQESLAATAQAV